jgi:hypothetical protein
LDEAAMAERISFSSVLKVAQAIAGWLDLRNSPPLSDRERHFAASRPMPALTGVRVEMARRLLGIYSEQDKNTGETIWYPLIREQLVLRLKKAGIDANTWPWKIADETSASWAWFQLRTNQTFREREQSILLNSGEQVPPLNIAWQKDVVEIQKNKKKVLEQQQTIPQYFMGQITEHLGSKPQLPRKGVGL